MRKILSCTPLVLAVCTIALSGCKPPQQSTPIASISTKDTIEKVDTTSESYRYAYYLVPLVMDQPYEDPDTLVQSPEFKAEFKQRIIASATPEQQATITCLLDRGVLDKLLPTLSESTKIENVQPRVAALWAAKYSLDDLKKFYEYFQLPAMNKVLALIRQGAIRKEFFMEDVKKLHQQGTLSEAEIQSFMTARADQKFIAFLGQLKPTFKQAIRYNIDKDEDAISKKMAAAMAMDEVHCAGSKGVGI